MLSKWESAYTHQKCLCGFADREAAEKWITSFSLSLSCSHSLVNLSNAERSAELFYVQTQAKSCIKGTERRFHWRSKLMRLNQSGKIGGDFSASPCKCKRCLFAQLTLHTVKQDIRNISKV